MLASFQHDPIRGAFLLVVASLIASGCVGHTTSSTLDAEVRQYVHHALKQTHDTQRKLAMPVVAQYEAIHLSELAKLLGQQCGVRIETTYREDPITSVNVQGGSLESALYEALSNLRWSELSGVYFTYMPCVCVYRDRMILTVTKSNIPDPYDVMLEYDVRDRFGDVGHRIYEQMRGSAVCENEHEEEATGPPAASPVIPQPNPIPPGHEPRPPTPMEPQP